MLRAHFLREEVREVGDALVHGLGIGGIILMLIVITMCAGDIED